MSIDTDVRWHLPDTIDLMQIGPDSIAAIREAVDTCEAAHPKIMLSVIDSCIERERGDLRAHLELLEFRREVMHATGSADDELIDNHEQITNIASQIDDAERKRKLAEQEARRASTPPLLREDKLPTRKRRRSRSWG